MISEENLRLAFNFAAVASGVFVVYIYLQLKRIKSKKKK